MNRIALDPAIDSRLQRMRRGVITSARLIQDEMTDAHEKFRVAFVTFTYRPGVDWSPMHIANVVNTYRKWAKRMGFVFRYVWVLELTWKRACRIITWPLGYLAGSRRQCLIKQVGGRTV